ncbi:hypothetical protein QN277_016675 [Acacia crassicarpa]|uniref:Pentatricopeptide repeat-containing protein n=1 Tax=Acacia crassicarpa TaxID=499986 RepID=A0AAE1TAR4_9FABA|nr:hypothetical protein QN277_016675 [Acacia crassicarpa]
MYKAQTLHASIVKKGLQNNVYHCNVLLQAYIKVHALSSAQKLLRFMPNPNVVSHNTLLSGYFSFGLVAEALEVFSATPAKDSRSWNILISGYVKNLRIEDAMSHFVKMKRSPVKPDGYTYSIVLPLCDLSSGRQVQAEIFKVCSISDSYLGTNILQMYASCGVIEDARKVFDEMPVRDLVTWNALISCYSRFGLGDFCLSLYKQMYREGILADEYTHAIILNEMASHLQLMEATQIHSCGIKLGFCSDPFITNSLLELYAKCGLIDSALFLFEEIQDKDVFAWTTIVTGLSQSGHIDEAVWLFYEMQLAGVEPNSFTFGGMLGACAVRNTLQRGRQLHGVAIKYGLENNLVVGSAISDMYSKCGEMQQAFMMFQSMPEKDIVVWNGIICGFAQNGEAMKALKLYNKMVQLGPSVVSPNNVTFMGVLSACSHRGLVQEGFRYFNEMIHEYKIKPKIEHYTCMVDLLGRSGLLEEAEALLLQMPFKADAVMWSTLLGACKLHGNLTMAKRISGDLHTVGPWNSSNYVLLANSYAFMGEWSETLEVREMGNLKGLKKSLGCSWIETGGQMHSFVSGDKSYPLIERVYSVLKFIYIQMSDKARKSV